MGDRAHGLDDLGRIARINKMENLELCVFDRVMQYCDDLVGRFGEGEHDSQRMEDVRLPFGGRVPLAIMSACSQRDGILDGRHLAHVHKIRRRPRMP